MLKSTDQQALSYPCHSNVTTIRSDVHFSSCLSVKSKCTRTRIDFQTNVRVHSSSPPMCTWTYVHIPMYIYIWGETTNVHVHFHEYEHIHMYMCLGYATKSTLGHKTDKTTHRELKLIGFVSVFDSASKSSKRLAPKS